MSKDKYAEDRETVTPDNVVAEITLGVKNLVDAIQAQEEAEEAFKRASAVVNRLKFSTLPDMFARASATGLVLDEIVVTVYGERLPVKLEEKVYAKLSEAKKDVVFAHIKEKGQEHLINSNIVVPFTRGQTAEMTDFLKYLENYKGHIDVGHKEEIHASVYSSWCDKNLKDNPSVDLADFGAHLVRQVKLGKPKQSKK